MHGRLDPWYRRIRWWKVAGLAICLASASLVATAIVWITRAAP